MPHLPQERPHRPPSPYRGRPRSAPTIQSCPPLGGVLINTPAQKEAAQDWRPPGGAKSVIITALQRDLRKETTAYQQEPPQTGRQPDPNSKNAARRLRGLRTALRAPSSARPWPRPGRDEARNPGTNAAPAAFRRPNPERASEPGTPTGRGTLCGLPELNRQPRERVFSKLFCSRLGRPRAGAGFYFENLLGPTIHHPERSSPLGHPVRPRKSRPELEVTGRRKVGHSITCPQRVQRHPHPTTKTAAQV
jgi:hypothetical protein